jgi:hypothetical protein
VSSRALTRACLLLSVALATAITLSASAAGDYGTQVEPAVRSLALGHLGRFLELQPAYGSLAALVQAPFVSLAIHLGAGSLAVYRGALFPCLLAAGLLGVALARVLHARGGSTPACLAVCALALVNPASLKAVDLGHPEEILTAALALGALLAAGRRHAPATALLLGLALASKQWAVLALPAVLLVSMPGRRLRVAIGAGAVALALTVPLAIAEPGAFAGNARQSEGATLTVSRFSVWWPLAPERTKVVRVAGKPSTVKLHRLSGALTRSGRPLAVALAFAFALGAALKRRTRLEHGLAVVALAVLLRCVLDPVDTSYYHVPFVLSLLAWESLQRRGVPLLTLLVSSALLATFGHGLLARPALDNAFYLTWALSAAAAIGAWLYAPSAVDRLLGATRWRGRRAEIATRFPHASGT